MSIVRVPNLSEIGLTGLNRQSGYIFEEYLPELRGPAFFKTIRKMREDPVINAVLYAIEMFARKTTFDVIADNDDSETKQDVEFIKGALDDMSATWQDTLAEILTMLPWGYSYHEVVYKERRGQSLDSSKNSKFNDGKLGWRKWPIRAQESLWEWKFDDNGGIQAMVQIPAPDFMARTIPIEKALHFRTTAHKNNPEGRSVIRPAYDPWYYKRNIQRIEGIGIERELNGYPVLSMPAEIINSDDPADAQIVADHKKLVTSIQLNEQGGAIIPSDVFAGTNIPQYGLSLLSTNGRRSIETGAVVQRYDQRMAICVLADFILLGHTQKSGSYGMADQKGEVFTTAIEAYLDSVCDVINRHAIPRLLRLNGRIPKTMPRLTHGNVESVDLVALADFISKLSLAGIKFSAEEQQYLKGLGGLPVSEDPEDELKKSNEAQPDPVPPPAFGPKGEPNAPPEKGQPAPEPKK